MKGRLDHGGENILQHVVKRLALVIGVLLSENSPKPRNLDHPLVLSAEDGSRGVSSLPVPENPLCILKPLVPLHPVYAQSHLCQALVSLTGLVPCQHPLGELCEVSAFDGVVHLEEDTTHLSELEGGVLGVEVVETLIDGVVGEDVESVDREVVSVQAGLWLAKRAVSEGLR